MSSKRRADRRTADKSRRPNYARWRLASLAAVYVLFVIHILHWKLAGRTLAPLELNEVMYTLELGIVTAGFLFMAVAVLATLIFGRFFCSWGCHILALEDLAAWLLAKLRIHPTPIRSRVLKWVPFGAMFYMFLWPQVSRLARGRPVPALHLRTDAEGWASFTTSDFWRNLPGPGVTIATFLVCGFVIVYLLGTRGFCTYACPYGAIFRIADRFAPGKITAAGDCSQCGKCTSVCQSHVLVHRELAAYGRVIDPACLKDLDCVAACPNGNVRFGFSKPAILTIGASAPVTRPAYSFSWWEEAVLALAFLAALLTYRGLYQSIPFLMSLALGGIFGYFLILLMRLFRRSTLRLNQFRLKIEGRLTSTGWAFAVFGLLISALTIHSAVIRYHEFRGQRDFESFARMPSNTAQAGFQNNLIGGIEHLEFCERWGLTQPTDQRRKLATMHFTRGHQLADEGHMPEALIHLRRAATLRPDDAPTHYNLGVILAAQGRAAEAIGEYRQAALLDPADAEVRNNLGLLLAQTEDYSSALQYLRDAIRLKPTYASPHFNLGRVLLAMGRIAEGRHCLETARRLDAAFTPYVTELMKATEAHHP